MLMITMWKNIETENYKYNYIFNLLHKINILLHYIYTFYRKIKYCYFSLLFFTNNINKNNNNGSGDIFCCCSVLIESFFLYSYNCKYII